MGDDASQRSLDREISELRAIVEGLRAEQKARQSRIAELLEASGGPRVPPPRTRHKRDRHGMHIVRGACPAALGGGLVHWLLRARWHRLVAGTVIATMAAAAPLSPDLLQPAPAAQVPAHHARDGDRRVEHRHRVLVVVPPVTVPRRRRKRHVATATPAASPPASPSPVPTPVPSPLPTIPLPSPVPSPLPSCVRLTGQHCHNGLAGILGGDAVGVPGALRGLTALS